MKKLSSLQERRQAGITLIELLIALMLIGITSAMALSFFAGDNSDTVEAGRDRRNAQSIATLAIGASACGVDVIEPDDLQGTVANLLAGQVSRKGAFKGQMFRLGSLTHDEINGALRYLRIDGSQVIYLAERG